MLPIQAHALIILVRDWSLITGRGGGVQNGMGGGVHMKFYPYEKPC